MVTHRRRGALAALHLLLSGLLYTVLSVALSPSLAAQQPPGQPSVPPSVPAAGQPGSGDPTPAGPTAQDPASQDPSGQSPGAPAAGDPGAGDPGAGDSGAGEPVSSTGARMFAVVDVESVQLRCFPTDHSPFYEDVLAQGAPLLLGDTYGSFRQVILPVGVLGYVHRDFVTDLALEGDEIGTVKTTEDRVSWRYRPQTGGEPPLGRLAKGALLYVVEEQGDWWRVRQPEQVGWVSVADVTVVEPPTPTVEKAWRDMEQRHRGVSRGLAEALLAADAAAAAAAASKQELEALRAKFRAELDSDPDVTQLRAIEASVKSFVATLPNDSALRGTGGRLEREIAEQIWVQEALAAVRDDPVIVPAVASASPSAPTDPLAKFDAVGWLVHHPRNELGRRFSVQKGEQILFWVTCSSGRYDLDPFIGAEVGILGPDHRPAAESLRILDTQKLQVLSPRRR